MARKTIIARNELITEAELVSRVKVGSIVRFTYTFEGVEYVCRGRVTGHEGEQLHVRVTFHGEDAGHVGWGMMWSARFCTIVRRAK